MYSVRKRLRGFEGLGLATNCVERTNRGWKEDQKTYRPTKSLLCGKSYCFQKQNKTHKNDRSCVKIEMSSEKPLSRIYINTVIFLEVRTWLSSFLNMGDISASSDPLDTRP
jgi:hypothetical protein